MDFFKPEMLQWTAAVIVPGFVAMRVYDLLVPAARRDWSKSILDLLVYGGINFALWFWWTDGLVSAGRAHRWWFGLAALGVLVFSPALLGALAVWARQWKVWRGRMLHPFPTAWDSFFSRGTECWVLVHLKDGSLVGGRFTESSFASAFPNDRDLYIREAWTIGDDGKFAERVLDSLGVWISAKDCELMEFFESPIEATHGEQGQAAEGR